MIWVREYTCSSPHPQNKHILSNQPIPVLVPIYCMIFLCISSKRWHLFAHEKQHNHFIHWNRCIVFNFLFWEFSREPDRPCHGGCIRCVVLPFSFWKKFRFTRLTMYSDHGMFGSFVDTHMYTSHFFSFALSFSAND